MSVVLRGFCTPWAHWVARWADARLQPEMSPLLLADMGRDGVLVGPYVSPRGTMRDEVVFYKNLALAERQLELRASDFRPWVPWLDGSLPGARHETIAAFTQRINGALAHLRHPMDRAAYVREIVPVGIDLVKAVGDLRGKPALPPEYKAKLAERDRLVSASAQEVIERMAAEKAGTGG